MTNLSLDAEALYGELKLGVGRLMTPDTVLVGIWSGGAWLAQRLNEDLRTGRPVGTISSTLPSASYFPGLNATDVGAVLDASGLKLRDEYRDHDAEASLYESVAALYTYGYPVDFKKLDTNEHRAVIGSL